MTTDIKWTSSEELRNHAVKILVEACTNSTFEVLIEMYVGKSRRGKIVGVSEEIDHASNRVRGSVTLKITDGQTNLIDVHEIKRIARAPS